MWWWRCCALWGTPCEEGGGGGGGGCGGQRGGKGGGAPPAPPSRQVTGEACACNRNTNNIIAKTHRCHEKLFGFSVGTCDASVYFHPSSNSMPHYIRVGTSTPLWTAILLLALVHSDDDISKYTHAVDTIPDAPYALPRQVG